VEILQFPELRSFLRRPSFRTACQLFPQLNWIDISSQSSLQSSTALSTTKPQLSSFITTLHGPNRKHRFQQFLYCCLRIRCRGNLFTNPLPSNERLWFHYSGLQESCHSIKKDPWDVVYDSCGPGQSPVRTLSCTSSPCHCPHQTSPYQHFKFLRSAYLPTSQRRQTSDVYRRTIVLAVTPCSLAEVYRGLGEKYSLCR
jgi:hypothetical protein